jgi:murein DD-endopeptidase MepM/ murein hydrolase activator NlpD
MVYSENRFLTMEEMTVNAEYILSYLLQRGWTKNAVAGMLGNMETESTINPGIYQGLDSSHAQPWGFGLVQWTPWTKLSDWASANGLDYTQMDTQLSRIEWEVANNQQWISTADYPLTFQQFKVSTESPEYLGQAFLRNYERPADQTQPNRSTQARYWFDTLTGEGGGGNDICFIFPTDTQNVTSGFRVPERPDHNGVDFAESGTHPIFASASGIVSQSYVSTSYGEVIFIKHVLNDLDYETVYAHMQTGSRTVSVGDSVTQGQTIGIMGSTGDSTGQHLHFELYQPYWTDDNIYAIDPMTLLGKGGCGGGGNPPVTNKNNEIIKMLLADTLNGWRW